MATDKNKNQLTITVSFKKHEEPLYNQICQHTDKSAYIKECVINQMNLENNSRNIQFNNNSIDNSNIAAQSISSMLGGLNNNNEDGGIL